ncbi:MAG: pyruvate dehydrogenase (acetyl-transferring) E1 component subunit alpha, partial [Candidatus Hydrogenedentes bacterium]|nr:pyruvate dehydrogenase (acetyl-transferring) E1 component subunit alpha [Candidatus Hydrogenedentota bacterium]
FEGDDCLYRSKDEVAEARQRDPIDYWKAKLMADGALTQQALAAMNEKAEAEVADAAAFADESPFPPPEDALCLTANP